LSPRFSKTIGLALIALACLVAFGPAVGGYLPGLPSLPSIIAPANQVTAVTYVYEKDSGGVPSGVLVALDRLNRENKILATAFEDDTLNGSGETPAQYKIALAAANEAGLPALVVQADSKVVRVVKAPNTDSQVLEAAR